VEWYAQRWLADTATGMAWRGDRRYVEIRYEDLVAEPIRVLRAVCDGIGVEIDAQWLAQSGRREESADAGHTKRPEYEGAVSGASVGRWRVDLTTAEQQEVERLCGPRLRELGYDA
jgi:hypothetical protein